MKKTILPFITLVLFTTYTSAQERVTPNKPFDTFSSTPGYVTINEVVQGFGLSERDMPYEKTFTGFTTTHGYQISKHFSVGGGTGLLFYNGGTIVPLFLDFRYKVGERKASPYFSADGGVLFDVANNEGTRLYLNPAAGLHYSFTRKLAGIVGAGLWSQSVDGRETFVNLRIGLVYKPR